MSAGPSSPAPVVPFGRETAALFLVASLTSLALAISHGTYLAPAFALLLVALALLAWRFVRSLRAPGQDRAVARPRIAYGLLALALAAMPVVAFMDPKLVVHARGSLVVVRAIEITEVLLVASYLPFLDRPEPFGLRRGRFVLFAILTAAVGIATLRVSPAPAIDVWDIQMRGAEALLRGQNPYATVTVPDTDPESTMIVPYVYAPGALYSGALGLLVGRDVRWSTLAAMLASGLALRLVTGRARSPLPSLAIDAPALLVWLMPSLVFILELSWIDPVQLMLVCVAVAAHSGKRPFVAAVAIGAALASKQSMFWLIPLAGFGLGFSLRHWCAMIGAWAALVAPFVLADFRALKFANFDFLTSLPPRSDALCVAVWFKRNLGVSFPGSVGFVAAAAVVLSAAWQGRRKEIVGAPDENASRAAVFARAVALTYFAFFFFNKWAFANYYFLVTGLVALAAATSLRCMNDRTPDV